MVDTVLGLRALVLDQDSHAGSQGNAVDGASVGQRGRKIDVRRGGYVNGLLGAETKGEVLDLSPRCRVVVCAGVPDVLKLCPTEVLCLAYVLG